MTTGIYCIKMKRNGMIYVGQSVNIEKRFKVHIRKLNKGLHINTYLQNSWNKYGEKAFEFSILEECLKEDLNFLEIKYINLFSSLLPGGYNLKTGGNVSIEYTEEVRKKIGDGNRGKKLSDETKKKISENNARGKLGKPVSEETRRKMSQSKTGSVPWNKGIPASDEAKNKMMLAKIGKKQSQTTIDKRSLKLQGVKKGKLGYKGVYEIKENTKKKFRAEITFKKIKYRLGNFLTPEEAATAYDKKALELYGENANTNFS